MIALFWWSLLAFGGEIEVESRVVAVTVFADTARVTREVTATVPVGRSDLVLEGLSLSLRSESLVAEGEGNAGAALTGIDLRPKRSTEDRDAQVKALVEKKRALEAKVAEHNDVVQRANGEIAFLTAVKPAAQEKLTEPLFLADDAPDQLVAVAASVSTDLRALYAERRVAEFAIRGLREEIAVLDKEIAQLGGWRPDSARVAVGLDAARAGSVTVRLSYLVPNAGWTPRYDARYLPDAGKVRLDVAGLVYQSTGEDWNGVGLTLSTADPNARTSPPVLTPFVLSPGYGGSSRAPVVAGAGSAFEFDAKYKEDVPSDGTQRRVPLTSFELPATVEHRVVARKAPSAWLTAKSTWNGEFALLEGPVSSYLGTAYVGQGNMNLTAPGQDLVLSFGIDDRVSVKRTPTHNLSEGAKVLGNREKQTWAFRTDVENRTGRPTQLVVIEQVPASRDATFEVKSTTTPPVTVPAEGVFEWRAEVANGAKQSFTLEYEVSWPTGQRPYLLD